MNTKGGIIMMLLFDMFVSLIPIAVIFGIIYAVILISDKKKKEKYEQSTYFRSTNIPYHELLRDKGRIGENLRSAFIV